MSRTLGVIALEVLNGRDYGEYHLLGCYRTTRHYIPESGTLLTAAAFRNKVGVAMSIRAPVNLPDPGRNCMGQDIADNGGKKERIGGRVEEEKRREEIKLFIL
jgi:hypothetical protein